MLFCLVFHASRDRPHDCYEHTICPLACRCRQRAQLDEALIALSRVNTTNATLQKQLAVAHESARAAEASHVTDASLLEHATSALRAELAAARDAAESATAAAVSSDARVNQLTVEVQERTALVQTLRAQVDTLRAAVSTLLHHALLHHALLYFAHRALLCRCCPVHCRRVEYSVVSCVDVCLGAFFVKLSRG